MLSRKAILGPQPLSEKELMRLLLGTNLIPLTYMARRQATANVSVLRRYVGI